MKLRNIASLIFRVIGALGVIDGFAEAVAALPHVKTQAFETGVGILIVGCCCIYYSKKLGALFCKGLEDGDA